MKIVLRNELLDLLISVAAWFEPSERVFGCRNAKDNKNLKLALAASAAVIVSSGTDLLVLHPWRGVHIVRPAEHVVVGRVVS